MARRMDLAWQTNSFRYCRAAGRNSDLVSLKTGVVSRKLMYWAFQSAGSRRPMDQVAGLDQGEASPFSSQIFTCQKQVCLESNACPRYATLIVRSFVILPRSQRSPVPFFNKDSSLATRI